MRPAAALVAPDVLDAACLGFDRAHKDRSARRVFTFLQLLVLAASIAGLIWAFRGHYTLSATIAHYVAYALFSAAILWRLFAAAHLRPFKRETLQPLGANPPVYTVLCPLYREANVAPDLVAALARIDYPKHALDIKLLIEADDVDTITAALAVAHAPHIEIVLIPSAKPRTKPKALNVGLARARGEFVVVYDAEDRPHPLQLRAALKAFEQGGEALACVQAPLVIDNGDASWIARQFALEYAIQFGQILPALARLGLPLPLGGTSNHFRVDALRASGGWDPYNVTEDADLGYRLARDGYRCGVIAPPTYEEAPVTLKAWFAQRARWIKGHMQTWLVLMRNPFRSAGEMGLGAFLSVQLSLASGIAASFAHGPLAVLVLIGLLTPFRALTPPDIVLVVSGYTVASFAALTAIALSGDLRHAKAIPLTPFYWPLATLAALRALWDLVVRPHRWDKTMHGLSLRGRAPFAPSVVQEQRIERRAA